jgi:hypothetical protein
VADRLDERRVGQRIRVAIEAEGVNGPRSPGGGRRARLRDTAGHGERQDEQSGREPALHARSLLAAGQDAEVLRRARAPPLVI